MRNLIIALGEISEELRQKAGELGVRLFTFEEIINEG